MSVITNNLLLGEDGYNISRSVRLRSSASAYFSRTPAGFGASTQTMSFWFKRGNVSGSAVNPIRSSYYDANNYSVIAFDVSAGKLTIFQVENGTTVCNKATDAVYRDPSAWYHVVINTDLSRSSGDKNRIYVNGVLQSCTGTDNQVYQLWPYTAYTQVIGYAWASGTYLDGYLTEINFIDGQALTPSSFGETDLITGVWKPKKYTGTYGTNGFFLNFSDNSNNTAATIGKDSSGNGNNWTPNNISVTSGVTYDSMLDVPTMWADGGNGRGNYATLNPLSTTSSLLTLSAGNLTMVGVAGSAYCVPSSILMTSGKWYFEAVVTGSISVAYPSFGIQESTTPFASTSGLPGGFSGYKGFGFWPNGYYSKDNTTTSAGNTYTTNDIIAYCVDIDNGKAWVSKNGTWLSSGDPSTGSNPTYTFTAGTAMFACACSYSGAGSSSINFGQCHFTYTPPTGFKALNTQNLPDATIKKGNAYFDATTFTFANPTTLSLNFAAGLAWFKARSNAENNWLYDSVRGFDKNLKSNLTDAEATFGGGPITTTSSSLTIPSSMLSVGYTYVGWTWKESASAGFDIVTFTNPSSGSSSFAHSLGVKPSMIITKARSGTGNWTVTHKSLGTNMQDYYLVLNSTGASTTSSGIWGGEPTSSVFYSSASLQVPSATMVAYLFAEVAGYSAFGSYTGNGSTDGPFVFTGFRPRYVLIKKTSAAGDSWFVFDSSRDTYNVAGNWLAPNLSNAETNNTFCDLVSNGFKVRGSISAFNASGETFIFAAFAENPTKYSLAR